ncbi:MAG: lysylphosphatidylglycerol synthase domain-containing protein [Anaerolineales bacterium]
MPWWRALLQYGFLALVLVFMGLYIADQWAMINQSSVTINWAWLILAQVLFTLGMGLFPFWGRQLVYRMDGQIAVPHMLRVFYLSMVAKYLPGSIWSLPSRSYLYFRYGLTAEQSLAVMIWEAGTMTCGAILLAIIAIPLLTGSYYLGLIWGLFGAFLVAFCAVALVLPRPWWQAMLVHWRDRLGTETAPHTWRQSASNLLDKLANLLASRQLVPAWPTLALFIFGYAAIWCVIGLGFAAIVLALGVTLTLFEALQLAALFAMGWAAGFLVLIAPSGIGVRDVILAAGVGMFAESPIPFLVAVIARLCWTGAELCGLLVALWVRRPLTTL